MASLTELSFNWTGFISAMISNIAFTYRSIYSKKAMVRSYLKVGSIVLKFSSLLSLSLSFWIFGYFICLSLLRQTGMDSTNVYAYISIIALLFCIPPAIIVSSLLSLINYLFPYFLHEKFWPRSFERFVLISDWGTPTDATWFRWCYCQSWPYQILVGLILDWNVLSFVQSGKFLHVYPPLDTRLTGGARTSLAQVLDCGLIFVLTIFHRKNCSLLQTLWNESHHWHTQLETCWSEFSWSASP